MRGGGASFLALASLTSIALAPTLAGAQPAPSAAPEPPPGLTPAYPPGVKPPPPGQRLEVPGPAGGPAGGPTGGAPAETPPGARPWPVYTGYYPRPYWNQYNFPPGMSLVPPAMLPYDDGDTIPHGYRLKARPVRSLVLGGSLSFAVPYLASLVGAAVIVAGSADSKGFTPLFAPVVGPFITVGTAGSTGVGTLWLVLDGLVQTGGAVMLIVGLAADEKFLERAATGSVTPLDVLSHPQVTMGPGGAALRWTM